MSDQDTIKKLQDKGRVQAWFLCSDEEKALYNKAHVVGRVLFANGGTGGTFKLPMPSSDLNGFPQTNTYLIDADYKPKPEYEKWEIRINHNAQLVAFNPIGGCEQSLWHCVSEPAFVKFFIAEYPTGSLSVDYVATAIREGHEVVARFARNP